MKKRGRRTQNSASGKACLLQVAQQHFKTFWFDGSSLRGIAMQADVDVALIHHTFRSKIGLWTSVLENLAADLGTENCFFDSLHSDRPVAERLSAFLDWFQERCTQSPYIHLIILQESLIQGERFQLMLELLLRPCLAALRRFSQVQ